MEWSGEKGSELDCNGGKEVIWSGVEWRKGE